MNSITWEKWENVEVKEEFPISSGTTVTFTCKSGYKNIGGYQGICDRGNILSVGNADPFCQGWCRF